MSILILAAISLFSFIFLFKLIRKRGGSKNLPGGSLGFPIVGETFSFLQAQKKEQGYEWVMERVTKYGPIFKTSLMGSPAIIIVGQAGNKFILGSGDDVLAAKQPKTLSTIAGKYNIFELTGSRYKLIKGAMMSFLKPESLQHYIKHMDDLVTTLILRETKERDTILAVNLMKKLTFNIACNIIFGIQDEHTMEGLREDFEGAFKGVWSLPLNIPGTPYWQGLRARSRIINRVLPILKKKKQELSMGIAKPTSDLLSCLLALKAENEEAVPEEMIVDNFITLMIASHDTSAILLSLIIRKLSKDPDIYEKVLEEQMNIKRNREGRKDKYLTWADIQKMKYTWRVAQELMRIIPPVFGNFRKALKDTSFGGYDIPKGWQLFWSAHGTHMNEDIFESPKVFDPSRFENPSKPIPPYAYIAFGGGIRTCIGNEFARVETLTTIHKLVTMYEWYMVHPDEGITCVPMPYPSKGLPIVVKPRFPL